MTPPEIVFAVVAAAGVLFAIYSNRSSVKNDLINAYEKRVVQLEGAVKELNENHTVVNTRLDLCEKDRKNLHELVTLRNPEIVAFIDRMQVFMETVLKAAPSAVEEAKRAAQTAEKAAEAAISAKEEAAKVSSYTVQNAHMLELLLRHFEIPLVPLVASPS